MWHVSKIVNKILDPLLFCRLILHTFCYSCISAVWCPIVSLCKIMLYRLHSIYCGLLAVKVVIILHFTLIFNHVVRGHQRDEILDSNLYDKRNRLNVKAAVYFAVSVLISGLTQRRQSGFYFRPEILYGVNFGTDKLNTHVQIECMFLILLQLLIWLLI